MVEHLKSYGYYPQQHAQNIWAHKTRRTKFCLYVDDFGIKYYSRDDAEHLISALKDAYTVTVDNTGGNFCGLHLEWNYTEGYVDISMPNYVTKALERLGHMAPPRPQQLLEAFTNRHHLFCMSCTKVQPPGPPHRWPSSSRHGPVFSSPA